MSRRMQIFVNTDAPLVDLVKTVEHLLNLTATQKRVDDHDIYVLRDDQMYVDIKEARDFENDLLLTDDLQEKLAEDKRPQ